MEDIVIVGAGIAGLSTALGLHRQGVRCIVLESSDTLRVTGFALTVWTNAWRALDAIGIGESLRQHHVKLRISGEHEVRCVKRKLLMEALVNELPSGTIRYSCKAVSVEEFGNFKLLHLADGSTLKTKVLIGCDGVNSIVANWLGMKKASFTGRFALRGLVDIKSIRGYDPVPFRFFGKGVRFAIVPCDDKTVYWFFTQNSTQDKELEENPAEMKKYVLSVFEKMPDHARAAVENSEPDCFVSSPLRYRHPWELLWGNISKGNVCVAGDALHPMTPDIGQGGCAALEDGVVLARCLGEALSAKPTGEIEGKTNGDDQYRKIENGLKKFASERRWRSFDLISTAYIVGYIQQNDGILINFLREKFLAMLLPKMLMKKADFDCGKLISTRT